MATAGQPVSFTVRVEGAAELQRRLAYAGDRGFMEAQIKIASEAGARLATIYREEAPKSKEGLARIGEAAMAPEARHAAQKTRREIRHHYKVRTGHAMPKGRAGKTFAESINFFAGSSELAMLSLTGKSAKGFNLVVRTSQGDKRRWLAEGTGIYGPQGQKIVPTTAKALAFYWQGQVWIRKSVKGQRPQPGWEAKAYGRSWPVVMEMGRQLGFAITEQITAGVK